MKKHILKKGLFCIFGNKTKLLTFTLATILASAAFTQAQVVLQDDFESYADTTALTNVWIFSAGLNGGIQLSTVTNIIPVGGSKSAKISRSDDRSYREFRDGVNPTEIPVGVATKFTIYTYNTNFVTNTRVISGVTHTNSPLQVDAGIGWFNNATAEIGPTPDVWDGTKYQGKHPASRGNLFFNLTNAGTSNRRIGWQRFDVERLADGVTQYYVDGILGRAVTNTVNLATNVFTTSSLRYAVIGFGLGTIVDHIWFDGVEVSTNYPVVTIQPTNITSAAGQNATFSVTSPNATSYQWRRYTNGTTVTNYYVDIPGATNSTLTVSNVATPDGLGYYAVMVSNANGSIGSRAATLTITIPSFTTQPTNQFAVQGAHATFTAVANGAPTLNYQWQLNSTNIPGATTASYTNFNVTPASAGPYRLIVTNTFGSVTSAVVTLTVFATPNPDVLTPLWKINTANTWFNTSGSTARGMAYYAPSNQVLVVSRKEVAGGRVYVLDAETGVTSHFLAEGIGVIAGGFFALNIIAVDDDGKIYVSNLTLDGTTATFKIYRYDNTDPATEPVLLYEGDPGGGIPNRWGDTLTARGSGANARILVGSRNGTQFTVINPNDLTTTIINVAGVGTDEFGLGLAFGAGDTFWAKVNGGKPLYHIGFDGVIAHSYTNLSLYNIGPIGVDAANNRLAANAIGGENPDNLRLYSIADLNTDPVLLDFEFYNHPNDNSPTASFGTGNVVFAPNGRVYGLNENQGLIAWRVPPPTLNIVRNGSDVTLSWTGSYTLQSTATVDGTFTNVTTISPYNENINTSPAKFFRLKQ